MNSETTLQIIRYFCVPGFAYVAVWMYVVTRGRVPRRRRAFALLMLALALASGVAGGLGILWAWPRESVMPLLYGQLLPILGLVYMARAVRSDP